MPATEQPKTTPEDIERELAAARARLADNVASLFSEVHPKAVVHRQVEEAKTFAKEQAHTFTSQFKDDSGWRVNRLVAVGGAVVGVVVFGLVIRAIAGKKTA